MVKYVLTFAAAILLFAACQKEEEGIDSFPILVTDLKAVYSSGLTASIDFRRKGNSIIQEAGFCIDEANINRFIQEKAVTLDEIGTEDSFQMALKRVFILGKKYYLRAYVKVNGTIVWGNEVCFTGQRNTTPSITGYEPHPVHAIDTIYLKGCNFELYKDSIKAFREFYDGKVEPMGLTYINETTLKLFGSFEKDWYIKLYFKKTRIFLNFQIELYNLSNFRVDKIEAYPGDTVTFCWDNILDKRDKWSLKIDGATPQIIEQTEKHIKVKLSKKNYPWMALFTYNDQSMSANINPLRVFEDYNAGNINAGESFKIRTKFPIDPEDVSNLKVYNLNNNIRNNPNVGLEPKYVDSRTIEFTPSELAADNAPTNEDMSTTFNIFSNTDYSSDLKLGSVTFKYNFNQGKRAGIITTQAPPTFVVTDEGYCNYSNGMNTGTILLESQTNAKPYIVSFPNFINFFDLAKDPLNNTSYLYTCFGYSYGYIYVADEKLHYKERIDFSPIDEVANYCSAFICNNKIYFLGHIGYQSVNTRDVFSFNLTTREYKKENIVLPWSDIGKEEYYDYFMAAIRAHNIGGDIYIDALSKGVNSIYKFNKNTMQFEYFADFPNNPNNSPLITYEFNDKWCVIANDKVWVFNGNTWDEWANAPKDCTMYFEYNGKMYFTQKGFFSLFMRPL